MIPLVILAGGRGTRLGSLGEAAPKFLMPVSDGRVFADLQLEWAHAQGFREVILCVGYRADQIREHVGDGQRQGLSVRYSEDGETALGTGGALKKALPAPPPQVALLYGDTLLDIDCSAVVAAAKGTYALMTVIAAPPTEKANIDCGEGVIHYDKRSPHPEWRHIDYGLSVLSRDFILSLPVTLPFDLADALSAAGRSGRLRGFAATRPFCEINTPDGLEQFRVRFGRS